MSTEHDLDLASPNINSSSPISLVHSQSHNSSKQLELLDDNMSLPLGDPLAANDNESPHEISTVPTSAILPRTPVDTPHNSAKYVHTSVISPLSPPIASPHPERPDSALPESQVKNGTESQSQAQLDTLTADETGSDVYTDNTTKTNKPSNPLHSPDASFSSNISVSITSSHLLTPPRSTSIPSASTPLGGGGGSTGSRRNGGGSGNRKASTSHGSPLSQIILHPSSPPSPISPTRPVPKSSNSDFAPNASGNAAPIVTTSQLSLLQQAYAAQQATRLQQHELHSQLNLRGTTAPQSHSRSTSASNPTSFPASDSNSLTHSSESRVHSIGKHIGTKARSPPVAIFNGVRVGGGIDGYGGPRDESVLLKRYTSRVQQQRQVEAQFIHQAAQHLIQEQQESLQAIELEQPHSHQSQIHSQLLEQQNDVAQQLAMLTMLNELKKGEVGRAQAQSAALRASLGMLNAIPPGGQAQDNGGLGPGNGIGLGLGLSSAGATNIGLMMGGMSLSDALIGSTPALHSSSPRVDPLFNPNLTSNVYINNLPATFTETQLFKLCIAFGPIVSVRMMLRESGTCYGFVLFETIEAAESCILWLRQFSDVHPSFARTPKIGNRNPPAENSSPIKSLASPVQFKDSNDNNALLTSGSYPPLQHQLDHASAPPASDAYYPLSINTSPVYKDAPHGHIQKQNQKQNLTTPANYTLQMAGVALRAHGSGAGGDMRAPYGRVSSLPLPALPTLFQQQATSFTPSPVRKPVSLSVAPTDDVKETEFSGPNLFIDGLPNTIDLPTLEALFSPHPVTSARFFRTNASDGDASAAGGRVVAFVRLSSYEAAEEAIDRLNDRKVPGWEAAGGGRMTVRYTDVGINNNLTLSEKRIQAIISQQTGIGAGSPLRSLNRKANVHPESVLPRSNVGSLSSTSPLRVPEQAVLDTGSQSYSYDAGVKSLYPAHSSAQSSLPSSVPRQNPVEDLENMASRNVAPLNSTQAHSPYQPGSRKTYIVNIPGPKRAVVAEHPRDAPHHGPSAVGEDTEDISSDSAVDVDLSMANASEVPNLPPIQTAYQVPNNTPSRSNHPQSGPRYIVQLPSSYLQQRTGLPLSSDRGSNQERSPSAPSYERTIPAPQFQMPPPSLFKAAPRSGPLSIRPPPPDEQLPKINTATTTLIDVEKSPTSSIVSQDTGTPATAGGPFTPFISAGTFSPAQNRPFGDSVLGKHEDDHPKADLSVRFVDVE